MKQDPNTGKCEKKRLCPVQSFIFRDPYTNQDKNEDCWNPEGAGSDSFNCKACCRSIIKDENKDIFNKNRCWTSDGGAKEYGYIHPIHGSSFYQCCKGLLNNLTKDHK